MSDNDANEEKKPFQLRAFPVESRKLAVVCAAKSGLTVPEWMDRAVHSQARIDQGENIFPPANARRYEPLPDRPSVNIGDLLGLLHAAAALAAANDRGLAAVPGLTSLVQEHVRAARGLPALAPRKTDVKLMLQIGKTSGGSV